MCASGENGNTPDWAHLGEKTWRRSTADFVKRTSPRSTRSQVIHADKRKVLRGARDSVSPIHRNLRGVIRRSEHLMSGRSFLRPMETQRLLRAAFDVRHLPWKLLLIPEGKVFPSITTVGSMMISRLRPRDPVTSRCPPPPSSRRIISLSCRSRKISCHSPLSRR
ncbi:hypothetical protein EYF80_031402 [Liparis tanakae]|uniref:Uncharacterized protein n=1 Tax=Liparis tanakae TaxID=230148 RepID=A0A4Z2GYM3_9TELE|nr:hypothetical protein EYF80_031402 [Liparis tanakae]